MLVKAGDRFVLAVLPSTSRVDLEQLSELLRLTATDVRLAMADELVGIFTDCEPGVVPPFGRLYDSIPSSIRACPRWPSLSSAVIPGTRDCECGPATTS